MLIAALLAAVLPYGNLTWRSVGPAVSGGRVSAVAGTPQNDQTYYIGTAGGGVWKSANGGATWDPVFDKMGVAATPLRSIRRTKTSCGSEPAKPIRATT